MADQPTGINDPLALWQVEIDADEGLRALEQSLQETQERLQAVEAGTRLVSEHMTAAFAGAAREITRQFAGVRGPEPITITPNVVMPQVPTLGPLAQPVVAQPMPPAPAPAAAPVAPAAAAPGQQPPAQAEPSQPPAPTPQPVVVAPEIAAAPVQAQPAAPVPILPVPSAESAEAPAPPIVSVAPPQPAAPAPPPIQAGAPVQPVQLPPVDVSVAAPTVVPPPAPVVQVPPAPLPAMPLAPTAAAAPGQALPVSPAPAAGQVPQPVNVPAAGPAPQALPLSAPAQRSSAVDPFAAFADMLAPAFTTLARVFAQPTAPPPQPESLPPESLPPEMQGGFMGLPAFHHGGPAGQFMGMASYTPAEPPAPPPAPVLPAWTAPTAPIPVFVVNFQDIAPFVPQVPAQAGVPGPAVPQVDMPPQVAIPTATFDKAREATKGFADLHKQLVSVEQAFVSGKLTAENAQKAIADVMKTVSERAKQQQEAMAAGHRALTIGYLGLTSTLMGFVRAGLQGTQAGERIGIMTQLISREIAAVFTPAIEGTIRTMQDVLGWFQRLTGAGQDQIRNWALMGVGALGFIAIGKRVADAVALIYSGFITLVRLNPFLGITAALGGLLLGTEKGRESLGKLFEAVMPLAHAFANAITSLQPIIDALAGAVSVVASAIAPVIRLFGDFLGALGPMAIPAVIALGNVAIATFTSIQAWITRTAASMAGLSAATSKATMDMAALAAHSAIATTSATAATTGAAGAAGAFGRIGGLLGGFMSFLGPIGIAATAIGGIASLFSLFARDTQQRPARPRDVLPEAGGNLESIQASFERIQNAVSRTDFAQRTRQQTLEATQQVALNTGGLLQGFQSGNFSPPGVAA